jgi:UDP-N-acetylmuramate: L-alanyl-gamma-D-glutamyl-meso-diaminopimelate ligase
VETFGIGVEADWQAEDVKATATGASFRLVQRTSAGRLGHGLFESRLSGEHNVRNALAALAAANAAGVSPAAVRDALGEFKGVKRRLELRGTARGVSVYDDFAHHPTAVRVTLEAVRQGAPARVIAVFEPRSYTSRTRVFQDDFAKAFDAADLVVVAAAHLPEKVPVGQRLSEQDLVAGIAARGKAAEFVPTVAAIVDRVAGVVRDGDRVVVLSNGGFGGIHEKLLGALEGV